MKKFLKYLRVLFCLVLLGGCIEQVKGVDFGAEPSTKTGIHGETYDKDLNNINGLDVNGEGKIVIKLSLGDVKKDNARRLKIKFEYQKSLSSNSQE